MIAQLQHDHDRLRDLADRLDCFLEGASPPTDPTFSQLRWMLVRELSVHLATERRTLTEWSARNSISHAALDLGLDDAFTQHIVTWSGASLSATWDRYRSATRALLMRLRRRMDFEERAMFPALATAKPAR